MEQLNSEKDSQNNVEKMGYGKWVLVFGFLGGLLNNYEESIQPHSLPALNALFLSLSQIIVDTGTVYFLILWIMDLIRRWRNPEKPENKKVKLVINIIFSLLILLEIIGLLRVSRG